jgi:hypothetical protein
VKRLTKRFCFLNQPFKVQELGEYAVSQASVEKRLLL